MINNQCLISNRVYAKSKGLVFSELYGMECIGLRYFNVFGRKQDPNGAYAAVIPLWVKKLINHKQPVINGDGSFSRDFTYIDNVVQANELAAIVPAETILEKINQLPAIGHRKLKDNSTPNTQHPTSFSEVFNVAFGGNTTLNDLFVALRDNLSRFDKEIGKLDPIHGPNRPGDIPHSMASIEKARLVLGYAPDFDAVEGFEKACEWYFESLK